LRGVLRGRALVARRLSFFLGGGQSWPMRLGTLSMGPAQEEMRKPLACLILAEHGLDICFSAIEYRLEALLSLILFASFFLLSFPSLFFCFPYFIFFSFLFCLSSRSFVYNRVYFVRLRLSRLRSGAERACEDWLASIARIGRCFVRWSRIGFDGLEQGMRTAPGRLVELVSVCSTIDLMGGHRRRPCALVALYEAALWWHHAAVVIVEVACALGVRALP